MFLQVSKPRENNFFLTFTTPFSLHPNTRRGFSSRFPFLNFHPFLPKKEATLFVEDKTYKHVSVLKIFFKKIDFF
jgi:hypothetical protein